MKTTVLFLKLIAFSIFNLQAQERNWKEERQAGLVFGLTQPLFVSGFNVEGVYVHKRLIFNYSHGMSLDFKGQNLTNELIRQGLEVHVPFTTGFGVGYRFTHWLNLRIEPKWHRFNFYYEDEAQTAMNRIASNNTFSLGLGLYGLYQPFRNKENWLNGFTIAPSVRFWPNLRSDFPDEGFNYQNKLTNQQETLKTMQPGIGFTPFIVNISVGYQFRFK